jgi:hypothetical protein
MKKPLETLITSIGAAIAEECASSCAGPGAILPVTRPRTPRRIKKPSAGSRAEGEMTEDFKQRGARIIAAGIAASRRIRPMSTSTLPKPRPICVSDRQLAQITAAAAVIAPADRDAFIRELHHLLGFEHEIGDGAVDRSLRMCMRRFFRPPSSIFEPHSSKRAVGPQLDE